ncbi:MAG: hypothetical protein WDO56_26770 [Gammaproteobacteria bacterium]
MSAESHLLHDGIGRPGRIRYPAASQEPSNGWLRAAAAPGFASPLNIVPLVEDRQEQQFRSGCVSWTKAALRRVASPYEYRALRQRADPIAEVCEMQRDARSMRSGQVPRWFVALCGLMIGSSSFAAGGMDFLNDLPAASLTREDRDLMTKSATEALESSEPNATRDWVNPKTGNSGNLLVRSQFTATDGATCKRVKVTNNVKVGSVKSVATHTLCKYEGRGWLLHPDAVPATASPK